MANDELSETPPKRRRFQFSLKLLLVLIGIMAVVFASIRRPYNQWLIERKVAARINELNGTVSWRGFTKLGDELTWPYISVVFFHNGKISDADLEEIGSLRKLHALILNVSQINAAGLEHLTDLQELEVISLVGTPTTDEGLKSLSALPNLKRMHLYRSQITDDGMIFIASMKNLSALSIDNTVATDAGIRSLNSVDNLRTITIAGEPGVSEEALLELRDQVTVQWHPANGGAMNILQRRKSPLRQDTTKK